MKGTPFCSPTSRRPPPAGTQQVPGLQGCSGVSSPHVQWPSSMHMGVGEEPQESRRHPERAPCAQLGPPRSLPHTHLHQPIAFWKRLAPLAPVTRQLHLSCGPSCSAVSVSPPCRRLL